MQLHFILEKILRTDTGAFLYCAFCVFRNLNAVNAGISKKSTLARAKREQIIFFLVREAREIFRVL